MSCQPLGCKWVGGHAPSPVLCHWLHSMSTSDGTSLWTRGHVSMLLSSSPKHRQRMLSDVSSPHVRRQCAQHGGPDRSRLLQPPRAAVAGCRSDRSWRHHLPPSTGLHVPRSNCAVWVPGCLGAVVISADLDSSLMTSALRMMLLSRSRSCSCQGHSSKDMIERVGVRIRGLDFRGSGP